MRAIDVSVVIVTWNGWNFTRQCLESLATCQGESRMEIIVVDNASSDGTPGLIRQQFPNVHLIENTTNEGFSRANNTGIRLCNGEYICLINSDVKVLPYCLARAVDCMEQNRAIGILGPRMLGPNGETRRSCMRFPSLWSRFCRAVALDRLFTHSRLCGGFLMRDFEHDRLLDVEVLNGWFWVVRKEALEQVGPLDNRFFIYGEDIDWCYRFKKVGWRVVFYPQAESTHYGGGSSSKAPIRFYLEKQKADAQYWLKHHSRSSLWAYFAIVALHELLRVFGHAGAFLLFESLRDDARYNLRRSVTCLSWLMRGHSLEKMRTQ
jgi:GT2 family glycosyltransferase